MNEGAEIDKLFIRSFIRQSKAPMTLIAAEP